MSIPFRFSLKIKLFKKLSLLLLVIPLSGCSNIYLQWWDEEMYLYRPSVIESAAMRNVATQERPSKIVAVGKTIELNFGLSLRAAHSANPSIAEASINERFSPVQPNKTITVKGVNSGITTVSAQLSDGKIIKITVAVTAAATK